MCGIFLSVCDQNTVSTAKEILKNETIHYFLSRRGPDHFEKFTFSHEFESGKGVAHFTLLSSVLQLRGCFVCNQPVRDQSTGNILQWNGQIFSGFNNRLKTDLSDTEQLMEALNNTNNVQDMLSVIGSIHGPWAFTFWDNRTKCLWIGRDILGRRSLCWNTNRRDQILVVSSVAQIYSTDQGKPPNKPLELSPAELEFEEMPTDGVYCFEFGNHTSFAEVISATKLYVWNRSVSGKATVKDLQTCLPFIESPISVPLNQSISDGLDSVSGTDLENSIPAEVVEKFLQVLSKAVEVRCGNHHAVCRKCFARYVKKAELDTKQMISSDSEDEVRIGTSSNTINGITFRECSHASTAVLFSGGIDSTVLALLADKFVPSHLPIDLLNVAFNNDAPDRETGLRAWEELRVLRPGRKWNFVSIHIGKEELDQYRSKHIKYLVKPLQSVLDDSIGCAIWFATRGKGLLMQEPGQIATTCQTRARVVLLGMGADEQLGGYQRHRTTFQNDGWAGLVKEIEFDVGRISQRNLGRDDRVTADHGIEARFPFLDENVINFLNGLPIWHKCNINFEERKGEKLLLRLLALKLGLRATSLHAKRAIQFGSRIVKLDCTRSEKGSNKSERLV